MKRIYKINTTLVFVDGSENNNLELKLNRKITINDVYEYYQRLSLLPSPSPLPAGAMIQPYTGSFTIDFQNEYVQTQLNEEFKDLRTLISLIEEVKK